MEKLQLTIGIVNWNTKEVLVPCLNSILKSPPLASFEIRVIDNGSTDGSTKMIERDFPEVVLTENAGNFGFAAAANQILRQSKAEYVFLLNPDTELSEDTVDVLVDFADAHPQAGAVGPLLLNFDGTIQISGRRFPSFIDASLHAFLGIFWPKNPFSIRYKMLDWDRQSEREVDWVSGAAIFIRREAARKINYFDDGYFMYVEDLDFCYRLWQEGWKVYFCPSAKVLHHIAKSSEQSSSKMIIEFQKSIYRFYAKRYKDNWKRFLKPLVAAGLAFRVLFLVLVSNFKKVWIRQQHNPP